MTIPLGGYCYPHFAEGDTKTWENEVNCPRRLRGEMAELRQDLNPGLLEGLHFHALQELSKWRMNGALLGTQGKGLSTSVGL